MEYDVGRAKAAVQFLVDSSYFHHHVTKLRNTVGKPRALPFRDDAEPLNELLIVGRQNLAAMENLIAVAEYKRGGKNEYQREYMAAKRKRDRKVMELEALMTGKTVPAAGRRAVLDRQYSVWNKEREKLLAAKGELAWVERNDVIRSFWDRKEKEIEALIEEAKSQPAIKRKYRVVVEKEPKTPFGKALANAVGRSR